MKSTNKNGYSTAMVLIIATALGSVAYSTMQLVLGESRRNKKAFVYHEARQAAEALLQCGFAELYDRYNTSNSGTASAFPQDALAPSNNPIEIAGEFVSRHGTNVDSSHVVIPAKLKYTSVNEFGSQDTELIAGRIPPGEWRFIDPNLPGNESDQLAGTRAFVRGIEMLSKATVQHPSWGTNTAYARQILEVREAPLFAYAIFYNVPMEIAPGPQMDVYGNVHSNADMWIQAGSGLNFHKKISTAGDIQHGRHPDSGMSTSNGAVKIANGSGTLVNMNQAGSWLDSSDPDFKSKATQLWNGNLITKEHNVSKQNPVGVASYIEDTDGTTAAKESYNSAYPIIQPVLNRTDGLIVPDESLDPTGYAAAISKQEIERQKYAYKAGLTIEVSASGALRYKTYDRNSDGFLKYDSSGDPIEIELTPSAAVANYEPFSSTVVSGTEQVTSGFHDARENTDMNVVNLDVAVLKDLIHNPDSGGNHAGEGKNAQDWGGNEEHKPESWWNGVVYVEFPQQSSTSSRPDNVNPAIEGYGLRLVNGETIPNPPFAIAKDEYGMSVATNQPMYVQGNYNADGSDSTGSPTVADNSGQFAQDGQEAPAALIADAITFLSTNWDDANSIKSKNNRPAADTEISAAILTGLVPSGKTGSNSYSGGTENFPRFLENWSGDKLIIRGSIVSLFESEVATGKWSGSYYGPPQRLWGFHRKFGEGYLPPGTPNTRTFRGRDYQDLSASEYAVHIERLKTEL